MKRILLYVLMILSGLTAFAQKEYYDIVTYTAPKSWKKEALNNLIMYSRIDGDNWAQLCIYDDGWVSSIKEDWVEVSKPAINILIHYPDRKADEHQFEKLKGDQNAWNILVAPRYTTFKICRNGAYIKTTLSLVKVK